MYCWGCKPAAQKTHKLCHKRKDTPSNLKKYVIIYFINIKEDILMNVGNQIVLAYNQFMHILRGG